MSSLEATAQSKRCIVASHQMYAFYQMEQR